jgi:hypothetical protein
MTCDWVHRSQYGEPETRDAIAASGDRDHDSRSVNVPWAKDPRDDDNAADASWSPASRSPDTTRTSATRWSTLHRRADRNQNATYGDPAPLIRVRLVDYGGDASSTTLAPIATAAADNVLVRSQERSTTRLAHSSRGSVTAPGAATSNFAPPAVPVKHHGHSSNCHTRFVVKGHSPSRRLTAYCELQRARAARRAISLRRRALSFAARALPPFNPPSRPNAIACGFFLRVMPSGTAMGLPIEIAPKIGDFK